MLGFSNDLFREVPPAAESCMGSITYRGFLDGCIPVLPVENTWFVNCPYAALFADEFVTAKSTVNHAGSPNSTLSQSPALSTVPQPVLKLDNSLPNLSRRVEVTGPRMSYSASNKAASAD